MVGVSLLSISHTIVVRAHSHASIKIFYDSLRRYGRVRADTDKDTEHADDDRDARTMLAWRSLSTIVGGSRSSIL